MMEVTSCGELDRQTPEGDTGHPLGDLCAKLRHWPKLGSQGEQVKPKFWVMRVASGGTWINFWEVQETLLESVSITRFKMESILHVIQFTFNFEEVTVGS